MHFLFYNGNGEEKRGFSMIEMDLTRKVSWASNAVEWSVLYIGHCPIKRTPRRYSLKVKYLKDLEDLNCVL